MRRLLCVITVCIMILSFCAGCSDNDRFGLGDNEEASVASSIVLSEADARQIADKSPIRLYFANEDNSKLKLEIRYIPVSETTKSVNHLAEIIVNELIKGPKVAGLKPTIPEGTKLRSAIKIEGDVAIVDFTKEFRDNHPGGKAEERMTIYSVVNSLTELKEINKVKFLIEGKSSPDFKGNFRFNTEFPRSTQLISNKAEPVGTVNSKDAADKKDDLASGDKDTADVSNETENESVETGAQTSDDEEVFVDDSLDGEAQETYQETNDDEKWQETYDEASDEEARQTFSDEFEETYIEYLE
ncbi:MAG: GerMN domain-containing protein [Hungateiclostridium thermocellum]|nr:GerMN domain-containing protein [Acetivibrio thermocellus]